MYDALFAIWPDVNFTAFMVNAGTRNSAPEESVRNDRSRRFHERNGFSTEHAFYGGNSRLDELHAAMLRVKLQHLEARNERRAQIAAYYDERLAPCVTTPPRDPRRVSVFHQYVVRTPAREELRAFLTAEGIETGVHYPTPIHRQPAWRERFADSPALPRAERVAREVVSLPVFPELTDGEVERVAETVVKFFA